MKKSKFLAIVLALVFAFTLGLVGCDNGKKPADPVVTVTAKQTKIELQQDEVDGYDYTALFTVTKDGASVTVTASMIDSSAVKAEAGTYSVKCTYEGKSASVSVTVLAKGSSDTPNPGGDNPNPGGDNPNPGGDNPNPGGDNPNPGIDWGDWADVHNAKATIKPHAEGTVTYRFQAECTDLRGKSGYGSSGTAEGSGMAMPIGKTNDGCVNYLFGEGITINFFVVSDRDVDDAELSLCLGAEGMIVPVSPETFTIRVDRKIDDEELYDAFDADHDGARGDWDNSFLNYHTLSSETDRVIINEFDACPEGTQIDGRAYAGTDPKSFQLYKITSFLSLRKGVNCVSIVIEGLAFPPNENYGTKQCVAPVVDYMDIRTNAQLGFFGQMDNGGFGTDGLSIVG